ncbi:MAG: aKG-HExxH-type peptide beta-hydroxylase, partial [Burkholderiales bacterium]
MQTLTLHDKLFSAIPQTGNAKEVGFFYRAKLKTSLIILLNAIEQRLQYNLESLKYSLQELQLDKKFSASLYHCYFKLLKAVREGNRELIDAQLNMLSMLQNNTIYCHAIKLENILTESWEKEVIQAQEAETCDHNIKKIKFNPLSNAQLDHYANQAKDALDIIQQEETVFFEEILEHVTAIKIHAGKVIVGVTSPKFYGAMYLSLPAKEENALLFFIEHIVHETSHLHLNCLLAADALILNAPTETYPAPIRASLRPMLGVYHATFVLSRMVRVFKQLEKSNFPGNDDGLAEKLALFISQFNRGYQVLKAHAKATRLGAAIIDS